MTTTTTTTPPDTSPRSVPDADVEAFAAQFSADLGAAMHAATVVLGDQLGLYRALADGGPQTVTQLAERTGCHPRLLEEWCHAQAASGYVVYEPSRRRFHLTPAQAACLADRSSPAYLTGALTVANAAHRAVERLRDAFTGGGGLGWDEHDDALFDGTARFFGARYATSLVDEWIPALDGVEERLGRGARVADVGCGFGASTILLARAFPASSFVGYDLHAPSVDAARQAAADAGLADRVRFEVADASDVPDTGFDLVCTCNAFHEVGDPTHVAASIRRMLADDGTWLLVEPGAGDRPEDNHTPTGRIFYSTSTLICVPNAVAQQAGERPEGEVQHAERALGAQAGDAALRRIAQAAGFTRFRRAAQTPTLVALEVRP